MRSAAASHAAWAEASAAATLPKASPESDSCRFLAAQLGYGPLQPLAHQAGVQGAAGSSGTSRRDIRAAASGPDVLPVGSRDTEARTSIRPCLSLGPSRPGLAAHDAVRRRENSLVILSRTAPTRWIPLDSSGLAKAQVAEDPAGQMA